MPTVYIRTLRRAAEVVGGEEELARRLVVTPSQLTLWITGLASPPGDVFLRAVDILSEYDLQQLQVKTSVASQASNS